MTPSRRAILGAVGLALTASTGAAPNAGRGFVVLHDATGAAAASELRARSAQILRLDPLSASGYARLRQIMRNAEGAPMIALMSEAGALVARTELARARGRLIQHMRLPRGVTALVLTV